ncbi:hypothetical protein ACD591_04010 [Rufibacter glacialis]|uniref:STAS/SEC14 domain-containing protein n=1 Tax=Rufibacter glacialis TaxID=1259555 RepID=A0A5M8QIA7_9BACT|nr:hypothetical protein [Rufibacter glacialis]KAA6434526.1 hypothetical protein FOE74_10080 [Rufibacter glacialis]
MASLIWKKEVSLEECQLGVNQLFQLLNEHELGKCLINSHQRSNHSVEAEEWELNMLQGDHFNFIAIELQVALVLSENKYQQFIHDYSLNRFCSFNLPIKINFFTQDEEALDWLLHEPDPLAS